MLAQDKWYYPLTYTPGTPEAAHFSGYLKVIDDRAILTFQIHHLWLLDPSVAPKYIYIEKQLRWLNMVIL